VLTSLPWADAADAEPAVVPEAGAAAVLDVCDEDEEPDCEAAPPCAPSEDVVVGAG
jgi:hypothetical protein